jgi:hypothetical protein
MTGPEAIDWVARIAREIEPLQRSWQRFAREIEPLQHSWQRFARDIERVSRAFVAARDRGDFRNLQIRLQLTGWMMQQFEAAKDNPSHRKARVWLMMQHLTPKQMAELLPYMAMDMAGDLRIPKRKGRSRGTAASTLEMVEQLANRIERTGELPTTAARRCSPDTASADETSKAGRITWCACGKIAL